MIREFLYLQKSDRKVILTLLAVIVVALSVIFLTGGENDETNGLVSADSTNLGDRLRDSDKVRHHGLVPQSRERTVYVRTKVIYRDTAYRRGRRLADVEHDSIKAHYQPKIRQDEHIVLNTADTTQLKMVPGIGPYFARKIVEYGQRLGGYVSVDQLDEIENFPLDSKKYLTIEAPSPVKLNINRLSLNELKRHPYINFYMARAITDYRRLHGPIRSLEELRLSKDFPPEAIERLLPYVAY
jgi:DNA uptake protein ComE-like DNA-binding protein